MPKTMTAQEVRNSYVSAMGAQFGEAFCDLYNHVASLYSKWDDYGALFGDNATIDLLNQTAPTIFHDLQLVLRESILLHVCRLTDKPQISGQDNLTIRRLDSFLPAGVDAMFRSALAAAVDDAIVKCDFARVWRNKHLAHTNLSVAAGGKAVSLPAAGKSELQAAIDAVGKVLNCVEKHYMNAEIGWSMFDASPVGVVQLLHYLRKGVDAQKRQDDEERKPFGGS